MRPENKLLKYYKKELKKYHKNNMNNSAYFMGYLITYLRFKRDEFILTEADPNPETNFKLASICLAIGEYDNYVNCIYKYYTINRTNIQAKRELNLSDEEIMKAFQLDKAQHWNAFCELLKLNMENWLA